VTAAGGPPASGRPRPSRLVLGISGATGAIYGVRLLQALHGLGVAVDLVVSTHGAQTLRHELDLQPADLAPWADAVHSNKDVGAAISSGSHRTDGMIVAPCSVKTLSGIVHSYDENLLIRAADVTLKERRPLVILFRETPLHLGHLRLLVQAAEIGAQIFPPLPAFYQRPETIDALVDDTVGRVLDQFGLDLSRARWRGMREGAVPEDPAPA
jgi:4-hydroxy-3-polyprenylbenzoate decarboxylase